MAAASCTEVPPNFITRHPSTASLPSTDSSLILSPLALFVVDRNVVDPNSGTNKKPTGQLLLAVGLVSCSNFLLLSSPGALFQKTR
jgi:hypothetical protein